MANHWVRCDLDGADGDSFDAATCIESIIGNSEAVYENSGYDQVLLLSSPETVGSSWYHGPVPIPARRDRDARWREFGVSLLACGGSDAGGATFTVTLTPMFRAPTDEDDHADIAVAQGTTPAWTTETTVRFSRSVPDFMAVDDDGETVRAYLLWWVLTCSTSSANARLCGWRVREIV